MEQLFSPWDKKKNGWTFNKRDEQYLRRDKILGGAKQKIWYARIKPTSKGEELLA